MAVVRMIFRNGGGYLTLLRDDIYAGVSRGWVGGGGEAERTLDYGQLSTGTRACIFHG